MIEWIALCFGAGGAGAGIFGALAGATAKKKVDKMAVSLTEAASAIAGAVAEMNSVRAEVADAIRAYPQNVRAVFERGMEEGKLASAERIAALETEAAATADLLMTAAQSVTDAGKQFSAAAAVLAGLGDEKPTKTN